MGNIVIWDVAQGESKTEFSDGNRPIQGINHASVQIIPAIFGSTINSFYQIFGFTCYLFPQSFEITVFDKIAFTSTCS